jgi:hypothetical protein
MRHIGDDDNAAGRRLDHGAPAQRNSWRAITIRLIWLVPS